MNCALCKKVMLCWYEDRRLKCCSRCNIQRCGRCGEVLIASFYPTGRLVHFFEDWIFPKKIMEFIANARPFWRCEKCGRKYPKKRDIFLYIFWELHALFSRS